MGRVHPRRLVTVVLLAVLSTSVGCAGTPAPAPEAQVRPLESEIVTQTAVGGEVSPRAVRLDGPDALAGFVEPFTNPRMAAAVADAADRLDAPDRTTWAAVVAVGSEAPSSVRVERVGDVVEVRAVSPSGGSVQCLAPATSVAVVSLPR